MSRLLVFLLTAACCVGADSTDQAVRHVLSDQVQAWNRGDIDAFMAGYENSPETTFIGKTVRHGYQEVLRGYHAGYPTREKMGTLNFTDLVVKPLGSDYASVTGAFHLTRTAAAGGDASGVFSLLFRHTPAGWKIILDHTS
jgi:ketosteroid isomerase-like protein